MNGEVTVSIDPLFAQTIDLKEDYHVLLTPLCQEPVLLSVAAKNAAGFTVHAVTISGQPANCSFDYRLIAKRLGYEKTRMESVDREGLQR